MERKLLDTPWWGVTNAEGKGYAYRVDRITGEVVMCARCRVE